MNVLNEVLRLMAMPMMFLWQLSKKPTVDRLPRPADRPQVHSSGHDSDRVLILGAGPAVGWGVTSHDLALPGALARALTARTRRGAVVDVVADPDMTVSSSHSAIAALDASRFDAIVVTLGVNDAVRLVSLAAWRRDLTALISRLLEASPVGTQVVIASIPSIRSIPIFDSWCGSIAARHAVAMNRETELICARSERVAFLPIAIAAVTDETRYRTPETYTQLATLIADPLSALLEESGHFVRDTGGSLPTARAEAESRRQRSVDEHVVIDAETSVRLDKLVALAKRTFQTRSAMFTVIDGNVQRNAARAGIEQAEARRRGSFCDFTIRDRSVMVVPDAREDERFRRNPLVVGDPRIRFYAGFPVEAPSGERIGALCVFDPDPRESSELDEALLREFALLVQHELWDTPPIGAPALGT